ncbi:MAG: PIN domain-containing protein [Fimbriimonas sp.]|nr:PIN domain-containing protein [Fimbriimonas sp.]
MPRVLIDTNVLLRMIEPGHPSQKLAVDAQIALRVAGHQPCIVDQNLIEFRAVVTRPFASNGLGMTQQQANFELQGLKSLYELLSDTPAVFVQWEQLVNKYISEGKQNHDARIVAAMIVHEVPSVLTFNEGDFKRYTEIEVFSPKDVLNS